MCAENQPPSRKPTPTPTPPPGEVHCLMDDVIASPRDGDIGAVFGVGFPPFRGGPFMWMDTLGPQVVVQKLQKLEAEFGPHFAPPQLLVDKAAKGELFHQ